MLYTGCRFDGAAHRGTVIDVSRTAGSMFAPSEALLREYKRLAADGLGPEVP